MKLCPLVICCFLFTIYFKSASGGLVINLIEKVHDTAHKVREDIKDAVVFKEDSGESKNDDVSGTTNAENKEEVKKTTAEDSTLASSTTTTPKSTNESTSDKDGGRENFGGGCLEGYQRTSDNRCMPTF